MGQQRGLHWRWEAWVGTGLTILVVVVPVGILLGQALGYRLSGDELLLLFRVDIAGGVVGVVLILIGIGVFRPLRRLRLPITFRSPFQHDNPADIRLEDNGPQILVSGRAFGAASGHPCAGPVTLRKLQQVDVRAQNTGLDANLAIRNDGGPATFGADLIETRHIPFSLNLPWPMTWRGGDYQRRQLGTGETQLVVLCTVAQLPDGQIGVNFQSPTSGMDATVASGWPEFQMRVRLVRDNERADYVVSISIHRTAADTDPFMTVFAQPWDER